MSQVSASGEEREPDEGWAQVPTPPRRPGQDPSAGQPGVGTEAAEAAEVALLQNELSLLRQRIASAPGRIDALERQVRATQRELEASLAQNARLADTLRSARSQITELKAEVERLSAAPHTYGTYLGPGPRGGLTVAVSGRKLQVEWSDEVRADGLVPGQEVLLNESLNVVGVGSFEDRGELMTVAEVLDDGRVLVVGRSDEERIVHLAGRVLDTALRAGDTVLVDVRSGTASERVLRSEVERLVLEEVPDVDYTAIGGLGPQIEAIRDAIELPYLHADLYEQYSLRAPKGILLYGPPGCGKTMIAKAVANSLAERVRTREGGADGPRVPSYFLNVKGPELLNKYVGETERQIRLIFQRAREKSREGFPVVVFFDEMESLFRTRGTGVSTDVETTIVPQLLAEIDGVESLKDVIVIGASNREDMIDPAILRPGRLDVKIKVERPDRTAASEIVSLYLTTALPIDSTLVATHDGDRSAAVDELRSTAIDAIYEESSRTEFLEVTYAGGTREVLHFRDFSSGAMIESVVSRAKRMAIKRQLTGRGDGIGSGDVRAAVLEEFRENEDLPNTSNPDDWARISGRRGEPIVRVRSIVDRSSTEGGL
jgi:proteasome-associated ATPase